MRGVVSKVSSSVWEIKSVFCSCFFFHSVCTQFIKKRVFTPLISCEALCCHCTGIIMPMRTSPVAEYTVAWSQRISMWGTAWGSRLAPRPPNCLNLNLRSFLYCSTNYPCMQLCGVSARRFGSIVPEHPPVGLHWPQLTFLFIKLPMVRGWGIGFVHVNLK